jgi:hypothetical protein
LRWERRGELRGTSSRFTGPTGYRSRRIRVDDVFWKDTLKGLGVVSWTGAFPGVMSIWNMPGTGVSTCGEALPPDGSMAIGPFEFATSDPTDPLTLNWGPSSQGIVRDGDVPGTTGLNCPGWDPNTNVLLSPPNFATLTWRTNTVAAPPPPTVPAVPRAILAGLALALVFVGVNSLRRMRWS